MGARLYRHLNLSSQGISTTGRSNPYEFSGRVFPCTKGRHWSVSTKGLDRLAELRRLEHSDISDDLRWKQYEDELPGRKINSVWSDKLAPRDKRYVVETSQKVIERCILMATTPGDLVFDPTYGSGTTAVVAKRWG